MESKEGNSQDARKETKRIETLRDTLLRPFSPMQGANYLFSSQYAISRPIESLLPLKRLYSIPLSRFFFSPLILRVKGFSRIYIVYIQVFFLFCGIFTQ